MNDEYILNRDQAAEHLGVSVRTLGRYMKDHGLPSKKKMGKHGRMEHRFSAEELDKWLYVRQHVEYGGHGDEVSMSKVEGVYNADVGQHSDGQGDVMHDSDDMSMSRSGDDRMTLVVSTLQGQIESQEKTIDYLREQLVKKDEQLERLQTANDRLQDSFNSLMQLHQAQASRLEYVPAQPEPATEPVKQPAKREKPTKKKSAKKSPKMAPDEREKIEKKILKMRKDGLSMGKIAKALNKEALPTFSGTGKWQPGTISNILQDLEQ